MSPSNEASEHALFGGLEAILFDLDGTLIDTDDMAVERLAGFIKPIFGGRSMALSRWFLMQSEMPGNLLVIALDRLGLDEATVALMDKVRRRRGLYAARDFRLLPGIEELVLTLARKYLIAIVTTRTRLHLDGFLSSFPVISSAVDATCSLQDTRRLKPDPRPIRWTAEKLKVPVEKCLMVGDTSVDIKAGRRAGAFTAGVLCGFGTRNELQRAGAHVILDNTFDLLQFI